MAKINGSLVDHEDSELPAVFTRCHSLVRKRLSEPTTYRALAEEIGIDQNALKQFVRRGDALAAGDSNSKINRGQVFAKIYQYVERVSVVGLPASSDEKKQEKFFEQLDNMRYQDQVKIAFYAIKNILGVRSGENEEAKNGLSGTYFCYRSATLDGFFVKSVLCISPTYHVEEKTIWEFRHAHQDASGTVKSSDGMFLLIGPTIYLLGDVSEGNGIDFICLNDELSHDAQYLTGFEVSIDHNRVVFFSRLILVKTSEHVEASHLTKEFLIEHTGAVMRKQIETFGINGDIGLGKSVLSSLQFQQSNTAVVMASSMIPKIVAP